MFGAIGMWEAGEPRAAEYQAWIRGAWERVRPFSTGGNYINFQTADEGDERIRATYGANFERLVEIKRKYDPDNLFRSDRNVRARQRGPADEAADPGSRISRGRTGPGSSP